MGNWIEMNLSDVDKQLCWKFANDIIRGKNQFDRMMKPGVTLNERNNIRISRTFVGKIGEIALYHYLKESGKSAGNLDEMFAIYEGQTNVDAYDFKTAYNERVDVKTAVFANHKNIVVPIDQFINMQKKYYVGIKLDLTENINDYSTFTLNCIKKVYICGYATYEELHQCKTVNLGECDCKVRRLNELHDIGDLVKRFE